MSGGLFDIGANDIFNSKSDGMFDAAAEVHNPFERRLSFSEAAAISEAQLAWEGYAELREDETIEEQSARVLTAAELAFKERAAAERERVDAAVDTEYWCCLVFQTRAQKEQFLERCGAAVESYGDKYIDGPAFARLIGRPVDPASHRYNIAPKLDARLLELSREWDELNKE